MSFDWGEFLKLARELSGAPTVVCNAEARQRGAIGRAYYAAFGQALCHLRDKDREPAIPTGVPVHKYVRRKFEMSSHRVRKRIGVRLNRLRLARNRADYRENVVVSPAECASAVTWAEDIERDLAGL